MFILKHVDPEMATGKVAEAYNVLPAGFPVPAPLQLMSASPDLAFRQSQLMQYFMNHDRLDMGLLAMIRYLVAVEFDYGFCIDMNAGLLQMAGGMTEADLALLRQDPNTAPLEEEQKALLLFVLKAVKSPEEIGQEQVDRLRELGWSDQTIFDATFHGASMVAARTLFTAFSKK